METSRHAPWSMMLWLALFALVTAVAQSQSTSGSETLTLSLTQRTGGALHVSWDASNRDSFDSFDVFLNDSRVANVPSFWYSAYGLTPDTLYNVTVQGNLRDASTAIASNALLVTTLNATVPSKPYSVELVTAGGGFLKVRVGLPLDTGGANVSNITLFIRAVESSVFTSYSNPASQPEFVVTGLVAKTMHALYAYVSNSVGRSEQSFHEYMKTTEIQNPGPCPAPTVVNVTGGSIGLHFTAPVDTGGARITGFVVYIAVNGSGIFEEVANTVTSEDFSSFDIRRLPGQVMKPLTPETRYDIKAIAINVADVCLNPSTVNNSTSNITTVWTAKASLPEAPPAPYFLSGSGSLISIQLLMPGNMRGATLTGFVIMVNGTVYTSVNTTEETPIDITGLTANAMYIIKVAVKTNVGVSDWSSGVAVSTSNPTAPSTPLNVSATGITSSQATISWIPPVNSGGASITDYRLIVQSSSGTETFYSGGVTSYRLNTLMARTVYSIKVVAINAATRESTTARVKGTAFQTLMPTAPSEPRGLRSVSKTGGVLEISWQAPETSGGVSDEDLLYNATLFPIASCFNNSANDKCQTCNLVRIPASDDQYNFTLGEKPCAQALIPVCLDGTSACCVTMPNTSFRSGLLCSRITGQGRSRIVSGGSTLTSFEGLRHSTTYYVGVGAINVFGRSKMTPIIGLRTGSQSAPGFPVNIHRINGTGGSLWLSWSPPLDTGGTTIIGYHVYRDYRQLTNSPVNPPFFDCGLVAKTPYVYGVSAVTASLQEGAMGSFKITTTQVTLPDPIQLALVARTVSQMKVMVTAACDTSGSLAPSYQYNARSEGNSVFSGPFVCCGFDIPGLDPGVNYEISVRVKNEAGILDSATSTFSTTNGIPLVPQWKVQRRSSSSLLFATTPTSNPDREIVSYDIIAYQDGGIIRKDVLSCNKSIEPGQWRCPETYRLGDLDPGLEYNISTRAIGVRGASPWRMDTFSTNTDNATGNFMIASQDYSANSGDIINMTIQRVSGFAGPASVAIDVFQPDTVVIHCECQPSKGCACGLYLRKTGTSNVPGVLQFLDGQDNQTLQVTIWEDDGSAPTSMAVILNLIGPNVVPGALSQVEIRVSPSQRPGFPCFVRSKSEVLENASFVTVNVIRVKGFTGLISFDIETFDISSNASEHYLPLSTSVEMTERQFLASFLIQLVDNSYYEGTRVFGIRLRTNNLSGPVQDAVLTRQIMILDDEDPSMGLPATPPGISIVRVTGGEVEVSWQSPHAMGSQASVEGYLLRASAPSNGAEIFTTFNISATLGFILSSLEPRRLYRLQVATWNNYGTSEFSNTSLALTTAPSRPSGPRNFRVLKAGSSNITLAWDAPRDMGGTSITGYIIWRWDDNAFRPLVNESLSALSFLMENLSAKTQYELRIAAVSDDFPASLDYSSSLTNLTAETGNATVAGKPPPPELLRPATGGSLSFLIREPTNLGGTSISNYSLYLRRAPSVDDRGVVTGGNEPFLPVCSDATPWANDSSARSCTVYALRASTSYEVYTVLYNDVGASPPSDRVIKTTKQTVDLPSMPENFQPSRVTAGNIYLTWDPPIDLGGADVVLGYTVFQKNDVYFSNDYFTLYDGRDSTDRQLAVKGLKRSSIYAFAVVAQTSASYCVNLADQQMSPFINVTTLSSSPLSQPRSVRQASASGGMIVISWEEPDDLAGLGVSGYNVELIDGDDRVISPPLVSTFSRTFSHTNLTELTMYRYVVSAFNADGVGDPSEIVSFTTTQCSAPSAVRNAFFEAGSSGGQAKISWDPPEDNGGRPIVYYKLSRDDRTDAVFTTTSTSFTDTNGLSSKTSYAYTIRAFNELYGGSASYASGMTGDPTSPQPPTLAGIAAFGGRIEVNWTSPQDTGGSPIIQYTSQLLGSDGITVIATNEGGRRSFTFRSLNATTGYRLSLQAMNGIGWSAAVQYNVSTGPVDLPGASPPPTASEVAGGSMRVTVYPPVDNGGEPVTLSLYNGSAVVYSFTQSEESAVIKGLTARTTYHFYTIANNSRGGTIGSELVVTTGEISKPSVVSSVQLVAASFDRLKVAWPQVEDTGGDVHLQYVVLYSECDANGIPLASSETMNITTPLLTATLYDLVNTSNYSVSVSALTSSGLSGDASPASVFSTEKPLQGRVIAQEVEISVQEDTPKISVPVLRVEGSYGEIEYSYETVDETAIAGTNYAAANGTLTMASGEQTATIEIALRNDATYKPNTTFVLLIRDGPTSRQTQTRVVLLDDGDAGFVSFEKPQYSLLENVGTVRLRITRSRGSSPTAVIQLFTVATEAVVEDRFTLNQSDITFEEAQVERDFAITVKDDPAFQYWPDSIVLGLRVLSGGALIGDYSSVNITAADDGDISKPKEITDLKQVSATGGAFQLQWSPPRDRGGSSVDLSFSLEFWTEAKLIMVKETPASSITVYNLDASTTYIVVIFSINSAGRGLPSTSLLASTTASTPPTAPLNVQVLSSSSASLLLTWDPPLDAGGTPVIGYTIYQVSSDGSLTRFSKLSCSSPNVCRIEGLIALTDYSIQVQAFTASVSGGGEMSSVVTFTTSNPSVPDAPPVANVTSFTAGAMTIKMFKPFNEGGSFVKQYRLFLRGPSDGEFTQYYEGTEDVFTVYRLERRSTYEIKYQVINSVGPSLFGRSTFQETMERSLPSAPWNLTSKSATGGSILLTWNEPLDIGGRPISGYVVYLQLGPQRSASDPVAYDGLGDPTTQGVVYGLNASTTYTMYIKAFSEVSNCYSSKELAASDPVQFSTTTPTRPYPEPKLLLVRTTGGIIELTWIPPTDTGGVPIEGYTLSLVSPSGTAPIFTTSESKQLSFIHTDLVESTVYTYVILGRTSFGDSPPSHPLAVKTLIATSPSAPRNLSQLEYVTGGAIQIGWSSPVDTGGQPLSSYWVYRDGVDVAQNLPATTTSFTDKQNLQAQTSYQYTVRAFSLSKMGSELSAPLTARTSVASRPQLPLFIANSTGASFIQVSWAADPDTGGLPVLRFDAQLLQGNTVAGTYAGIDTSFRFTRLLARTRYTLQLVVRTRFDVSEMLSANFATLDVSLPAPPLAPAKINVFGGNFTVEVAAPIDTGGSPITELRLYEAELGLLATASLATGVLKAQLPVFGVFALTRYTITATAVNVVGESLRSPALSVETRKTDLPGPIKDAPTLTAATGTTLTVAWSTPTDTGGDAALTYEVRFNNTKTSVVSSTRSTTTAAMGTRFDYVTLYSISVRAVNGAGNGSWSPPLSAKTLPDAAGEFNFATTAVSVLESASEVLLTVSRTKGLSGSVTLKFEVSPLATNPATNGTDYALVNSAPTIRFASLQTSAMINISIINDAIYEAPDEQFTVELKNATGEAVSQVNPPTIGANSSTVVTILDDGDAGTVGFSKPSFSVLEDGVYIDIPIDRLGGSSGAITLNFDFNNGTALADQDFRRVQGLQVKMASGQTVATVRVSIINDRVYEFPDESFSIQITSVTGGARLGSTLTTIVILDDGDVSVAAAPGAPTPLVVTGGGVTLDIGLPAHNGSSKGVLQKYVVRIFNQVTGSEVVNQKVDVTKNVRLGGLKAETNYNASVAAINAVGQGPFSAVLLFKTTIPTLPAKVTGIIKTTSTGGSVALQWSAPSDTGGIPITKYRIYILLPSKEPQLRVEIPSSQTSGSVLGLQANTNYTFVVQAGNAAIIPELAQGWGNMSFSDPIATGTETLPAATVVNQTAYALPTGGSIALSWTPSLDTGGVNLTRYDVYARTMMTGFSVVAQVNNPANPTALIEELSASTVYEIFVLSINKVSQVALTGQFSCSPGSSSLITTQDLSKRVSAGDVVRADQGIFVIGDMALATKGTLPLRVPFMGRPVSKVPGVVIGTANSFVNMSTGNASLPKVPPQVTLINATGGALAFQVESPRDTGGLAIENFNIYVNGTEPVESVLRMESKMATSLRKTLIVRVGSLNPLVRYSVAVVALNSLSVCDFNPKQASDSAVFSTKNISQPEPPVISVQSISGGGMVFVLLDPFDKGGHAITRFQLYMATNMTAVDWKRIHVADIANDSSGALPTATVASLRPGTEYYFMMSANNGFYESANTSVSKIQTSAISPPGQCTAPRLLAATGGRLVVEWDDPLDNGGEPVIDFTITIQGPRISVGVPSPKTTYSFWKGRKYTFDGLTSVTAYTVSVRARNSRGLSIEGVSATLSTTEGTPPVGAIVVNVLSSTGGAAIISFNEPVDFGGTLRENMVYNVYVEDMLVQTLSYAEVATSLTPPATTNRRLSAVSGIIVGGLNPLGLYKIQVQAKNAFVAGKKSTPSPAITSAATRPSVPQSLQTSLVTGGSVFLKWQPPADSGGLPVVGYLVFMGASATGPFNVVCRETIFECRVFSLSAATAYWFYVVASNAIGDSPQTSVIKVTTAAVSLPRAPDSGGTAITDYTVSVKDSTAGASIPPVTTSASNAVISGLSPSTNYSITVTARNRDNLISDGSSPLFVVTARAANAPAQPIISCVSTTAVSLSWYPYPGATRYRLSRDNSEVYSGTSTDTVDSVGVVSGKSYSYRLEVETGGSWTGVPSEPVIARTPDDASQTEVECLSSSGYIREKNYVSNITKTWLLDPQLIYKVLTIEITSFDLECDHDLLSIETTDGQTQLWRGGCRRSGTFIYQSTSPVRLRLNSNATVQNLGFELYFETDRLQIDDVSTRIPAPRGPGGAVCSDRGVSTNGGVCKCSVGFTGEACSNYIVCCADSTRCNNPICDRDPGTVVLVSDEFGDDTYGTGRMMDTSEKGTSSKAVKTLSKALSLAKDGDIVFVYPGTYKGSLNRDLRIESRKDLTVMSLKGYAWTTIDCEGLGRASQLTNSSVSIQGFTIRNGLVTSTASNGGTLLAINASLALLDVWITQSAATWQGGSIAAIRSSVMMIRTSVNNSKAVSGGGAYLEDSTLLLTESNVTACNATNGAGLFLIGTTGVTGGLIRKNVATNDGGGVYLGSTQISLKNLRVEANEAIRGGGILAQDGRDVVLEDCQVVQNNASTNGGGMSIVGSMTLVGKNTLFEGNTAVGSGGGIYVQGEQVSIRFDLSGGDPALLTRLRGNTAASGSGLFVAESVVLLSGLSIQNGSALVSGGGMYVDSSKLTLHHVSVSSNTAVSMGGGVFAVNSDITSQGTVTLDFNNASIDGGGLFLATSNTSGDIRLFNNTATRRGGGFHAQGTVNLMSLTVESCSADEGGGGFLDQSTVIATAVAIKGCNAITSGGGLYMSSGTLVVVDSIFDNGQAISGGGIYAEGGTTVTGDLFITQSKASESGGGLYAKDKLIVSDVRVTNSSAKLGGGVFTELADAVVTNVTLTSCSASVGGGGWRSVSSTLTLTRVRIESSNSDDFGGGIAIDSTSVVHNDVAIVGNKAKTGGGLYVTNSNLTTKLDPADDSEYTSTIDKNNATEHGGNVYIEGTATLTRLLVSGGVSDDSGGGVAMQQATTTISLCRVMNNSASVRGGGLSLRGGSKCLLGNSNINENVASGYGGAVSIDDSVLTHKDVNLHANQAPNGGCFALAGKSSVLKGEGSGNSAINASTAILSGSVYGNGSAFYIAPDSVTEIVGMSIANGSAAEGGLFVDSATVMMDQCTFVSNVAFKGAALFATESSVVNVTRSTFEGNYAMDSGGVVHLQGSDSRESTASFDGCNFTSNGAVNLGGAVSIAFAKLTFRNTTFDHNKVTSLSGVGGAIASTSRGSLNITNCTFTRSVLMESTEKLTKGGSLYLVRGSRATIVESILRSMDTLPFVGEGGIVYVADRDSELSLIDCEVALGQSYSGGSIFVKEASLSIVRSDLRDHYAYEFAGGVYMDGGTAEIVDSTIQSCEAFYDGGGIYVKGKSTLVLRNTTIKGNHVQDGGGGLSVASGGGASVNISNSSFILNYNRGLGSAIYVGRKNTLTMTTTELHDNGGNTDGGCLSVADAQATVTLSNFVGNVASRGAAIELSRSAQITLTNCNFTGNQARATGGAIYMSMLANATFEDAHFQNNRAMHGGVAYLVGSPTLVVHRSTMRENIGYSFGGVFVVSGRATAKMYSSVVQLNRAYTGGAMSIIENGSLVLDSTELSSNTANDFGGGLYIDTLTPSATQSILIQSMRTRNNTARTGADVYWEYNSWYSFECGSCASFSTSDGKIQVASSPAYIAPGWWPTTVTSGVPLSVKKPLGTYDLPSLLDSTPVDTSSAPGASPANRRLLSDNGTMDPASLFSVANNPKLTSRAFDTLWPTTVITDFYGTIAKEDNRTECTAMLRDKDGGDFEFSPGNPVSVKKGYVTFVNAVVMSSRPIAYKMVVKCTLGGTTEVTTRDYPVDILVNPCDPGYENADGIHCTRCKKDFYSLDGVKCHPCPLGAVCEWTDSSKAVYGVSVPTREEGYYLYKARDSYLQSDCDNPSAWEDSDPCKKLVNKSEDIKKALPLVLLDCSKLYSNMSLAWTPNRIFTCLSRYEYYTCDTRDACIAEGTLNASDSNLNASATSTTPPTMAPAAASALQVSTSAQMISAIDQTSSKTPSANTMQCEVGYGSLTCATCLPKYYKVSNGMCKPCENPKDPAVARITRLMALVPVGLVVVALLFVWYFFSNATESEIMIHARAARKFQVFDAHSHPQSLVLAAKFFIQRRVNRLIERLRESLERRHRRQLLFGIKRHPVAIPSLRAEKFKILLAFFQIFGGFKKLYEIPWPEQMTRLMDIFTIADFSLVDTTGIECFFYKDYFANYRLSMLAVVVLLSFTLLLLSWGVVRYRVKLAGLPRNCVRCGLPVFQMTRQQPKTIVRRATMVSMLRIQRKIQAENQIQRSFSSRTKEALLGRIETTITGFKAWWAQTHAGRALHRFIVFTQLPASCSEHKPACPTSQQIDSQVLTMVVRSNLRLWRARVRLRLNYRSFQNKCIKLLFWILLLFYPELSLRAIGMFYCEEIGPNFYMSRDKSQLCYEGTWLYYLPLTMFLLVVWVAGVPLLFWILIFVKRRSGIDDQILLLQDPSQAPLKERFLQEMRDDLHARGVYMDEFELKTFELDLMTEFLRNKKLNEPSTVAQVGFIYHSYRTQFWWFEVWDLCRKLCLNCVVGILTKTGANRIIAGLVILLIYLSTVLFCQPYKDRSDSALASVTQIQLFVTLFCGLMLKMGALHLEDTVVSLLTYTAFYSNAFTMVFAFGSILSEKINGTRRARRRVREDHRRAIKSHVRKLWYRAYGYAFTEVYLRDSSIRPMPVHVILELARRDREAKQEREMELQLARSLHVRDDEDDNDELSSSQIEVDLPRPRDVLSPRAAASLSSSASLKEKANDEPSHSESDARPAEEVDNQEL